MKRDFIPSLIMIFLKYILFFISFYISFSKLSLSVSLNLSIFHYMNFLLQHFQSISPTFSFDIFLQFLFLSFVFIHITGRIVHSIHFLLWLVLSYQFLFFLLIKKYFFLFHPLFLSPFSSIFFHPRIHKKYYLYEKYRLCNIFNELLFDRLFSFYINPNPNQINLVRYNSIGRPERLHMTSHMRLTWCIPLSLWCLHYEPPSAMITRREEERVQPIIARYGL